MIFLVEDELDAPVAMDVRDRVVAAPWDDEAVLAQLDEMLGRESSGSLPPSATEEPEEELREPAAAPPERPAPAAIPAEPAAPLPSEAPTSQPGESAEPERPQEPPPLALEREPSPEPTPAPAGPAARPEPPAEAFELAARPQPTAESSEPAVEPRPLHEPPPLATEPAPEPELERERAPLTSEAVAEPKPLDEPTPPAPVAEAKPAREPGPVAPTAEPKLPHETPPPAVEPERTEPPLPAAAAAAAPPVPVEALPSAAQGEIPAGGQAASEVEGELAQMSLTDLLQVFHINQKSGMVRISRGRGSESIQLVEGQVVDAKMPLADGSGIRGEKALFRLLAATEGRFEFVPGDLQGDQSIRRPTRALLLEAVRQSDEWERYLTDLPAPDALLSLVGGPEDVDTRAHPLTAAVLQTLSTYPRVGDLVDHCPFPDYQVLRAIGDLLSRGVLRVTAPAPIPVDVARPVDDRTFDATQVRRIREWRAAQGPGAGPIVKVLLIPADREVLDEFAGLLSECPDYEPVRPQPAGSAAGSVPPVGPLGHFPLGERQKLRLVAVSPEPVFEPLWNVAAHGLLGAIVVLRDPPASGLSATGPLVAALRRWTERPVVYAVLTEGEDATLEDLVLGEVPEDPGAGVFAVPGKATPERRAILQTLLARLAP
jgi:hypothetical protein